MLCKLVLLLPICTILSVSSNMQGNELCDRGLRSPNTFLLCLVHSTFVTSLNLNSRDYQEGGETKTETTYTYSESFYACVSLLIIDNLLTYFKIDFHLIMVHILSYCPN